MSALLPVGSVVKLKQDEGKKVDMMVLGYYPAYREKYYDYLGVIYPGGTAVDSPMHLFNREDVAKVLFEGYSTEESRKALEELDERKKAAVNEESGTAAASEAAVNDEKDIFF